MPLDLSPIETRILGCLLEKERTTPESYPLSLISLTAACNQTTNRDPIVGYDERTIERGLDDLRAKKLAMLIHTAGARVPMSGHENGASGHRIADDAIDCRGSRRGQMGGRLVKQESWGVPYERPGEGQLLTLARGELGCSLT